MKCPVCDQEFGYLHLDELIRKKSHTEFNCPKCKALLSNVPVLKVERKMDLYIYGALCVVVSVLLFELLFREGDSMSTWSVFIVLGCSGPLLLGWLEFRKIDSLYYQEVTKQSST